MAQTNPISLLLNRGVENQAVTAPAFSITKVIATSAVVLAPLGTYLVKAIANVKFTPGQVVALIVAILAVLALTSSADVLARSIATRGQTELSGYVPVDPVVGATLIQPGADAAVDIVAMRRVGDTAQYLVYEPGKRLRWVGRADLAIGS